MFGHERRADFQLKSDVYHLNHGGYGATPRVVLEAAGTARDAMEENPSIFFQCDVLARLREAACQVAEFLGGAPDDWAFVENATSGLNAIFASLALGPGDELICFSVTAQVPRG